MEIKCFGLTCQLELIAWALQLDNFDKKEEEILL